MVDRLLNETARYLRRETFIVGFRSVIYKNGSRRPEEKEGIHVRDIEKMTASTDEELLESYGVLPSDGEHGNSVDFDELVVENEKDADSRGFSTASGRHPQGVEKRVGSPSAAVRQGHFNQGASDQREAPLKDRGARPAT